MKKIITAIIFTQLIFAITPPAKNGKFPLHLREQIKKIQSGYEEGFWAETFKARRDLVKRDGMKAFSTFPATDTLKVPVLFGVYSDYNAIYSTSSFQAQLFDGPNPTRTLTEFYTEISYGKMYMTGKCLGWFKLPRNLAYYANDGGGFGHAGQVYGANDFVIDLMILSDSTTDYSKYVATTIYTKYYDTNYAYVPYLGIYHSGTGAEDGGNNIWSHKSKFNQRLNERKNNDPIGLVKSENVLGNGRYKTNDTYNGKPVVIIGDFAIQPELSGNSNTSGSQKPIGVAAHEFGHIFGLPDLYDGDGSTTGIGDWCLMANGTYGQGGIHPETPVPMSAWCKEQLGWVIPKVLTNYSPNTPVRYAHKYPDIFKIYPNGIPGDEYFLIENRQRFGFDIGLIEPGILIWHIDNKGQQSNENRRLVDLEQADGKRTLNLIPGRGDRGDPFPGLTNNKNFDGHTIPNSTSNLGLQTHVGVRKISNSDTIMFASFDMGTRPYVICKSIELSEVQSGNGNGRLDPGESGKLNLVLQNTGPKMGNDLNVEVSTDSRDIILDSAKIKFSINSLETKTILLTGTVKVNNTQAVKRVKFDVKITSAEEVLTYSFYLTIGYPKILVVSSDTTLEENITGRYPIHFARYNKEYEIIQNTSIKDLAQQQREIIIWASGRKKVNTINDAEGDSLLKFLNRGGRLFINGQNFAEDFKNRNSQLSEKILRASFRLNVGPNALLRGIPTDMLGSKFLNIGLIGDGGGAIANQTSRDGLLVDTTIAHPIFRWGPLESGYYAGVWWENNINKSKVVYFAFGLEGVNDSTQGQTTSYELFSAVMDYLQTPSVLLQLSTRNINFGQVKQHLTKDTTFVITNLSTTDTLVIMNMTAMPAVFTTKNYLRKIPPSGTRTDTIRFTPVTLGSVIGGLGIISNTAKGVDTIFLSANVITSVPVGTNIPTVFSLEQNYPNPFNPQTTIKYGIPNESIVKIEIFNMLGQKVDELLNEVQSAHYYEVVWNGKNVSSGMYFYKIEAIDLTGQKNKFTSIKKMILMK